MVFPLFTGLVLSGLLLGQGGGFNRELGQKAKLNLSPPLVAPVRRELSRHCLPWETAIASTTAIAPAALSSAPLQRLTIWNLPPPERLSYPFLTSTQLEAWARQITVQIQHQGQSIGSGILVQVHGNQYTVLTSHHLFLGGESQYSVQTADGRKHGAVLLPRSATETLDLQLLQFSTPSPWYPVAPIGGAPWTQLNEPVAAAGFPIQYAQDAPLPGASGEGLEEGAEGSGVGQEALPRSDLATEPIAPFAFRPGVLSMVLAQPLEGGYQLGFTSDVFKGFSGGPLLNAQGQVVGIVGRHANPLWEVIQYYEDGTEPSESLQQLISGYSWAIPIHRAPLPVPVVPSGLRSSPRPVSLPSVWLDVFFPVPVADFSLDRWAGSCAAAGTAGTGDAPAGSVPTDVVGPGSRQ